MKINRCTNCDQYFRNIPKEKHGNNTCYGRANPPSDCGTMISILFEGSRKNER